VAQLPPRLRLRAQRVHPGERRTRRDRLRAARVPGRWGLRADAPSPGEAPRGLKARAAWSRSAARARGA